MTAGSPLTAPGGPGTRGPAGEAGPIARVGPSGIVASLRSGFRRARREGVLALALATPSFLVVPLFAVPLYRALAAGLPADPRLLRGLDGAAAVDLLNRGWPGHGDAVVLAALAGGGVFVVGGFLVQAAAARALARRNGHVEAARLLAILGEGIGPIARLLGMAALLHLVAFGFVRILDGFLEVAAYGAATDAAADRLLALRIAVPVAAALALRSWCRLAVVVSARERSRSALEAFGRAASLATARPSLLVVDLAAAGLGVAAAALASLPRWLLPQVGWATVIGGLLLAQAPVLVRAFFRTAAIAATLAALAGEGTGRPRRNSRAG